MIDKAIVRGPFGVTKHGDHYWVTDDCDTLPNSGFRLCAMVDIENPETYAQAIAALMNTGSNVTILNRKPHPSQKVILRGVEADIDIEIVEQISFLNKIPELTTEYSCQGDDDQDVGSRQPYVSFYCTNGFVVDKIKQFCYKTYEALSYQVHFSIDYPYANWYMDHINEARYSVHFENKAARDHFFKLMKEFFT